MAKINLLPWREERREELKKEFLTILGAVAMLGVVLILLIHQALASAIEYQQSRNNYLQQNINELKKQVEEIESLKAKREQLLDRMKVIQDLQGNRPVIVRFFDEMVRTLPDGVYYTRLESRGQNLKIQGTAESNNRVSSLMRRLDESEWFANPNLTGVRANAEFGDHANDFIMNVGLSRPKVDVAEEEEE